MGSTIEIRESPDELKELAEAGLRRADRRGFQQGRRDRRAGARGEADHAGGAQGGDPPPDLQDRDGSRRWAVPPSRTRASSPWWMRWSIICPARWTFPPARGMHPERREEPVDGADRRQRQVLLAGLQALDRPVRRQAGVLPRLSAVSSRRATPFTIRAPASASASAA